MSCYLRLHDLWKLRVEYWYSCTNTPINMPYSQIVIFIYSLAPCYLEIEKK